MSFDRGVNYVLAFAAGAVVMLFLTNAQAQGQPDCKNPMTLQQLTQKAYENFGEVPYQTYIANNMYVQIFLDPDDQSWTLATVTPDGTACPRAEGEGMVVNPVTVQGDDS